MQIPIASSLTTGAFVEVQELIYIYTISLKQLTSGNYFCLSGLSLHMYV